MMTRMYCASVMESMKPKQTLCYDVMQMLTLTLIPALFYCETEPIVTRMLYASVTGPLKPIARLYWDVATPWQQQAHWETLQLMLQELLTVTAKHTL